MSAQAIQQFRKRVNDNEALQARFLQAYGQGPSALVALGRESGFDFTEEEVRRTIETAPSTELYPFEARLNSGELSDRELEMASGGGSGGAQNAIAGNGSGSQS